MLGLFLLGFWFRRVSPMAAFAGTVVGVVVIAWMALSPMLPDSWAGWRSPFHSFLTIVFGTGTILVVGVAISLFAPRRVAGQPTSG